MVVSGIRGDDTTEYDYDFAHQSLLLFVAGYAILFVGSGADAPAAETQPDPESPIHEHGPLVIERNGSVVNLSGPEYVEHDDCFHFHDAGAGNNVRVVAETAD
ncbi:hypothetical protein [Natrononativus amylolyticus]|uniref:hypothetical protein n=1 Tax=Natrononativus amylolyticus TaxID=2963434 RepID=UPI0020CE8632|nr:hypothetical protein [Natrononativus amylolyticus]